MARPISAVKPLRRVLGTRSDGQGGKLITLACGHVIRSQDGRFTMRMACPECIREMPNARPGSPGAPPDPGSL
jgi:hypothetical protein